MKRILIILTVLIISVNIKAQIRLEPAYPTVKKQWINTGIATAGIGLIVSDLKDFKYASEGAALIGLSYINDRYDIKIESNYKDWIRLGLYTMSIVTDAIGDARFDIGYKKNGKFYQAVSIGALLGTLSFSEYSLKNGWKVIITYSLLRYSMFDYTYNYTRDLPLEYRGSTTNYDNTLKHISNDLINSTKRIAFVTGIIINFN